MPRRYEWDWLFEELQEEPSFVAKTMFGCRSVYLNGKLVFVLAENQDDSDWNGLLIPTSRELHPSLLEDFPEMICHKILGKWIYLSLDREDFEDVALKAVALVKRRDARFGVVPEGRKAKAKAKVKVKAKAKLKAKAKMIRKKK